MKVTTEELANRELQLNIEIEPAEVEQAMRAAARRLAAKNSLPGFRRGKAPYNVVLTYFGREAVLDEALEPLTEEMYRRALDEADVHPIGPARVEDLQREPLVLHMVVPLVPTVDPGPYREFRLPFETPIVSDDMVDRQLDYMRDQQAVIAPAERPAQLGDQVRLSVSAREGEQELFVQNDFDLTLSDEIVFPARGFAQYVVGLRAGEHKTVEVDYPADYEEAELRGKHATLDISVSEVKSVTLPELDDEFAKGLGEYENLLDLRVQMRAKLFEALNRQADNDYAGQVVDALAEHAQIAFPPTVVEGELDDLVRDLESRVKDELHLSFEDYLKTRGQSRDEMRAELRPRAELRLRRGLLLTEIANREKLDASEAEISAEIDSMVAAFGDEAETARKVFEHPANREMISNDLLTRKVIALLVRIAKGEDVAPAESAAPEVPAEPVAEAAAAAPAPEAGGEPAPQEPAAAE